MYFIANTNQKRIRSRLEQFEIVNIVGKRQAQGEVSELRPYRQHMKKLRPARARIASLKYKCCHDTQITMRKRSDQKIVLHSIMHPNLFIPNATPATYTGSCHCKAIRFRVTMPSIAEYPVSKCNCTVCTSLGLMNMIAWREDLQIEGENLLKEYQFGKKRMKHKFCPTCSSNLFVYHTSLPHWGDVTGWVGVNVRIRLFPDLADASRFETSRVSILMN